MWKHLKCIDFILRSVTILIIVIPLRGKDAFQENIFSCHFANSPHVKQW